MAEAVRHESPKRPQAEYRLVGKMIYKQGMVYYQVIGLRDGKLYNINRAVMTDLAKRGMCDNARVQMYNGMELLRGDGININELVAVNPQKFAKARKQGYNIVQSIKYAQTTQQKVGGGPSK